MKKIILILGVVSLLALFPSCSSTEEAPDDAMNMINPYVNHISKKEAEKHVGFSIKLSEAPFEVEKTMYRENILDSMLEIIMYGEGDELRIRKAPGNDDISGNWNDYDKSQKLTIGRNLVTLEGDEDRGYQAIWTDGKYSYSAYVEKGLPYDEFIDLVKDIR